MNRLCICFYACINIAFFKIIVSSVWGRELKGNANFEFTTSTQLTAQTFSKGRGTYTYSDVCHKLGIRYIMYLYVYMHYVCVYKINLSIIARIQMKTKNLQK